MRVHEAGLGSPHRLFPLALPLDIRALLCQPTLFNLDSLHLKLAHQLWEPVFKCPALAVSPTCLAAVRPANELDVELAGRTAVVGLRALVEQHFPEWLLAVFLPAFPRMIVGSAPPCPPFPDA